MGPVAFTDFARQGHNMSTQMVAYQLLAAVCNRRDHRGSRLRLGAPLGVAVRKISSAASGSLPPLKHPLPHAKRTGYPPSCGGCDGGEVAGVRSLVSPWVLG